MKKYSLLINEDQLRQFTPLSGTFDFKYITPHIIIATDIDVQPIVGNALYQRLLDGVNDDDLNADELTLLNDYVAKSLAHWTMYHAYLSLSNKLIKSTITKVETDDGSALELDEIMVLKSEAKTNANTYTNRLISYLNANSGLFPEYTQVIDGELEASDGKTNDFGFSFGGEVQENNNNNSPKVKGDMLKSVYDTNDSGVVDDAEKVNGLTVETAVPSGALFTDTQVDIQAGTNVTIDKTDPLQPIINSGGGGATSLTWSELVAKQVASEISVGDGYIITDQSNLEIIISYQSPDGNSWFDTIDNEGAIITQNIE